MEQWQIDGLISSGVGPDSISELISKEAEQSALEASYFKGDDTETYQQICLDYVNNGDKKGFSDYVRSQKTSYGEAGDETVWDAMNRRQDRLNDRASGTNATPSAWEAIKENLLDTFWR